MQPERHALVARLNARTRHHSAADILHLGLTTQGLGKLAIVSSFGAESVALLHLLAVSAPHTDVLFIDTQMLFAETLVYQQELSERLGLRNLRILRASDASVQAEDPDGALHLRDPDACCALRKTRVLQLALQGFDGWITGRKRYQSGSRAEVQAFELDPLSGKIKVNPLAHWRASDVAEYIAENRLPKHPMVARGYPSIGCAPCTSAVGAGEDPRAGRWRGTQKTECGLHMVNGKMRRTTAPKQHKDTAI